MTNFKRGWQYIVNWDGAAVKPFMGVLQPQPFLHFVISWSMQITLQPCGGCQEDETVLQGFTKFYLTKLVSRSPTQASSAGII